MESSEQPRATRRSAGEWLFQFTTITIGVLIALSFDALLRWNADRALVEEARETIALEIADNRRELEGHLATFEERLAKIDPMLKLLSELDGGVEPTVEEIDLTFGFPSLNDAAWQTAERTGALALMEYLEVQRLAGVYALQSLVVENLQPTLLTVIQVGSVFNATDDPFTMSPATREALRSHVLDLRAHLALDQQLGNQLLEGYAENSASRGSTD
jgi:hypothetical protein